MAVVNEEDAPARGVRRAATEDDRARRPRPADALRHDGRARRGDLRGAAGRGAGAARAERRRQDDHDRDPGGLPDALGRRGRACSASTRRTATRPGGPGSAWCCSPGATTASGGSASCCDHLGALLRAVLDRPRSPRPWDVDELIEAVGLTEHADKRIGQLSGGQRRRLDVAIGIVGRPELLFLDEPTAGFDPEARREFHDLVHRLADLDDTTILLTTHDLDEAEKLADRILILAGGRIIADGSADELARRIAGRGRGALDAATASGSCTPPTDATAFVRELFAQHGDGDRRPRGAPGQPGGHLHGDGPRVRGRADATTRSRAFEEVTR